MAAIVSLPSFAGTAGQEIDVGDAGWTVEYQSGSGVPDGVVSSAARAYAASGEAIYVRDEVPGSANQIVRMVFRRMSAVVGSHIGVIARKVSGATRTYFLAQLRVETGPAYQVRLYKVVGATATQIGSSASVTVSADGDQHELELDVSGQAADPIDLIVRWDGSAVITQTSADAALNGTGGVGIRFGSSTASSTNTTGSHIVSFEAEDDTAGSFQAAWARGANRVIGAGVL
jgi:hypothetical protein